MQHYGLAVDDPACPLTWAQFVTRVQGLFAIDCRTSRHFAPPESEPDPEQEVP